jgi:hypothetical protein
VPAPLTPLGGGAVARAETLHVGVAVLDFLRRTPDAPDGGNALDGTPVVF